MMLACERFYNDLNLKCGEIVSLSFKEDDKGLQSVGHSFLSDMEDWTIALKDRLELPLFISAQKEYQYGLLSVVQGQYRQAYMALRLFLEQLLAGVYYSTNEIDLRMWLNGKLDIFWNNIIDDDNGVFSSKFCTVFCPQLLDEIKVYNNMAKELYRECSEYIHANIRTHNFLPNSLEYSKAIFEDWHEKADTARIIAMFALFERYISTLSSTQKVNMEHSIMEFLGHHEAVRELF